MRGVSFTLGRTRRYICEPRDQVPRLRGDSRELFSAHSWRHIKLRIMVRAREGALLGDVFISEMLSILYFSMGSLHAAIISIVKFSTLKLHRKFATARGG